MSRSFEEIAIHLQYGGDNFNALFRQAEQQLRKEQPGGFDVTEIGKRAWSMLPVDQYPEAFRTLFYCYWLVDRDEQEDDRQREAALAAGTSWLDESDLGKLADAVGCGPDDNGTREVDYEALAALVAEVGLLRRRMAVLRDALVGEELPGGEDR